MTIRLSKKVIIIIGIFIVVAGLGGVGFVFKDKFPPYKIFIEAYAQKKLLETGPLLDLEEIVVNLNGGGILKTEITIEGTNSKSGEHLKAKEAFLRDRTISVLASKEIQDVRTDEGRYIIKEELIREMNRVCPNEVKDVLFRNFIHSI